MSDSQKARDIIRKFKSGQTQNATQNVLANADPLDMIESTVNKILAGDGLDGIARKAGIVKRGLLSGAAGLATLPYELPSMAIAGIEGGAEMLGYDVDVPDADLFKMGAAYGGLERAAKGTMFEFGLPEDATEAEKLLYYGIENLPVFGAVRGGAQLAKGALKLDPKSLQRAATTLTPTTRTAADVAQGALAGRVAEEDALAGVGLSLVPTGIGTRTQRVPRLSDEATAAGREMASTSGVSLTRGQAMYNAALKETDTRIRNKKMAEAEKVLADEERGRLDPNLGVTQSDDVRTNIAMWWEADRKRSQQTEEALRKIAGVTDDKKITPEKVGERIHQQFLSWSQRRMKAFKLANERDFGKIDPNIKFDMSEVVDEIDTIFARNNIDVTLRNEPGNLLLKVRSKLIDDKGRLKELNALQVQQVLSDLGTIAWKGKVPGLKPDSIDSALSRRVANQMITSFKDVLTKVAEGSEVSAVEADKLLKARESFSSRIETLKGDSDNSIMEFFNFSASTATAEEVVQALEKVSGDSKSQRILGSLMQKERKDLWPEVRTLLFNRQIQAMADPSGFIDLKQFRRATQKLRENSLLFGDPIASKGVDELDTFINRMEGVFARFDDNILSRLPEDLLGRKAKIAAEAVGTLGGASAGKAPMFRYAAELIGKVLLFWKRKQMPVNSAAMVANDPELRQVFIKALQGRSNEITPNDLTKLEKLKDSFGGRLRITTKLAPAYFGREDEGKKVDELGDRLINIQQNVTDSVTQTVSDFLQ